MAATTPKKPAPRKRRTPAKKPEAAVPELEVQETKEVYPHVAIHRNTVAGLVNDLTNLSAGLISCANSLNTIAQNLSTSTNNTVGVKVDG